MNNNSKQKTVVVLGMHRSGTSMTAGILTILGINMGDKLIGPSWSNPLGHFEDKEFVELNDKILDEAGGSWYDPPPRKEILKLKSEFSQRIKSLLLQRELMLWGWKDPRTSLTIELYLPYLKNPYFVVCYREPKEIAQSLWRRDKTKIKDNLELIKIYYQRVNQFLKKYSNLPRIIVSFNEIMQRPVWVGGGNS